MDLIFQGDVNVFMDVSRNPGPDVAVTTSAAVETTQQFESSAYNLYGSLELLICSLPNKLYKIKLLFSTISSQRNGKPNLILGISETFLNGLDLMPLS